MALSIKHPEADRLARELAKRTGEGLTEVVIQALRERLDRTKKARPSLSDALLRIGRACALLPVLDGRSADDILGYGDGGLPE